MTRVTLSGLQRATICTASAVLPRYESHGSAANLGNALHEMIDKMIKGDRAITNDAIADAWDLSGIERGRFFTLARTFRPKIPAGTVSEAALGLFEDGDTSTVEGARGDYKQVEGLILAGTIDAMWSEPEPFVDMGDWSMCPTGSTLWVVDWKTGTENNVPPPAKNWQLRAGAVLAALQTQATRVIPAICFVEDGEGRWDIGAPIEAAELEEIKRRLLENLSDIETAARDYEAGIGPRAVTGSHCEHCPARPGCPSHVAEARAMVTDYAARDLSVPLSAKEAAHLAAMLPTAEKVLEQVKKAIRAYAAENGPIPLADGRVYGPQHAKRDTYATRPSYEALAAEIGEEAADEAFRTSKGAMYDAIGAAHDAKGIKRKKGAAMANVLEKIKAGGGLTSRVVEVWTAHHPGAKGTDEP